MTSGKSDPVEIAGEMRRETEKAYLVFDGSREAWVPKSQVEWDEGKGVFTMPEWLAIDKGFI